MLEIIVLLCLLGVIGNMALRRGRSQLLLGLALVGCWFGGEVAGGMLGYALSALVSDGRPNLLLVYGSALVGAALGSGTVLLVVRYLPPVNGVWRDLASSPFRRSRVWGAIAGGLIGGVFGAVLVVLMYGQVDVEGSVPLVAQGFLAVGFTGTLLGLVTGVGEAASPTP